MIKRQIIHSEEVTPELSTSLLVQSRCTAPDIPQYLPHGVLGLIEKVRIAIETEGVSMAAQSKLYVVGAVFLNVRTMVFGPRVMTLLASNDKVYIDIKPFDLISS